MNKKKKNTTKKLKEASFSREHEKSTDNDNKKAVETHNIKTYCKLVVGGCIMSTQSSHFGNIRAQVLDKSCSSQRSELVTACKSDIRKFKHPYQNNKVNYLKDYIFFKEI